MLWIEVVVTDRQVTQPVLVLGAHLLCRLDLEVSADDGSASCTLAAPQTCCGWPWGLLLLGKPTRDIGTRTQTGCLHRETSEEPTGGERRCVCVND